MIKKIFAYFGYEIRSKKDRFNRSECIALAAQLARSRMVHDYPETKPIFNFIFQDVEEDYFWNSLELSKDLNMMKTLYDMKKEFAKTK